MALVTLHATLLVTLHAQGPLLLFSVLYPNASVQTQGSHRGTLAFHPLRAAVLEKMPLVERSDPHVDEEGKEQKAGAQLLEASTPVPTEPQVRRLEDLSKEDFCGCPRPAMTLLPFCPGH